MKAIMCILLALSCQMMWAMEDVSLRLSPNFYDPASKSVYVDVEVKYEGNGDFKLAGQSIRLYYDSDQLRLQKDYSRSDLPQDVYTDIKWHRVMENIAADNVNDLTFDDKLGFINFSIELMSLDKGGINLDKDDSWQRIAVLNFKVDDADALTHIVWSSPEVTSHYATAYVEVMEWIEPHNTQPTAINTVDAEFNLNDEHAAPSMTIFPNPARDIVTMSFDRALHVNSEIRITDITGRLVTRQEASAGDASVQIDVTSFAPGTYVVEVINLKTEKIELTDQLIKVD